jgi:hypothetical protein
VHLGAREEVMVAGGETRLRAMASDSRAREGREIGDNRPVTILTPRRSSGGSLRWQRSGGTAEAWRRRQWKSSRGLRFQAMAAAAALGKPRARGRLGVQARDTARVGWRRIVARLGLESEPGMGKGKALTGGTHLPARGGGKGRGSRPRGRTGPGREQAARGGGKERG